MVCVRMCRPPESAEELEIKPGTNTVGGITFSPELVCAPDCYTGLDLHTPGIRTSYVRYDSRWSESNGEKSRAL